MLIISLPAENQSNNEHILCHKVPNMKEILLIGFYQPNEELTRFLCNAQQEFKISIRYCKLARPRNWSTGLTGLSAQTQSVTISKAFMTLQLWVWMCHSGVQTQLIISVFVSLFCIFCVYVSNTNTSIYFLS